MGCSRKQAPERSWRSFALGDGEDEKEMETMIEKEVGGKMIKRKEGKEEHSEKRKRIGERGGE